ncbi:MAG: hypothetical protein KA164_04925 [Rhodoferax sp.]|nr:hypothetical protein [Rhodoferax sp.]
MKKHYHEDFDPQQAHVHIVLEQTSIDLQAEATDRASDVGSSPAVSQA